LNFRLQQPLHRTLDPPDCYDGRAIWMAMQVAPLTVSSRA